jgi:hypothetical protein
MREDPRKPAKRIQDCFMIRLQEFLLKKTNISQHLRNDQIRIKP